MRRKTAVGIFAVLIAATLIASGALLSYYGKVETVAHVQQSVLIDGSDYTTTINDGGEDGFNIIAGCTEIFKHKILNQGCVGAPIGITTSIIAYGKGTEGVNVDYYIMNGWKTLHLEDKSNTVEGGTWTVIEGDYYADFSYNPCCPDLDWTLVGTFAPAIEYVLIYYADQPERFTNWGGAPALEIATFTSDATTGDFSESGTQNLGACIPYETDWNIGPDAHYRQTPDFYNHGKGAKIWLIPLADYNDAGEVLKAWNPANYLFETDLIAYFDCNINPVPTYLFPYFVYETPVTLPCEYTLQPGEEICLFIKYNFDVAIKPGQYDITTKIVPTS